MDEVRVMRENKETAGRKKRKNVTLYNVLFPFWMMRLFPIVWIVVIPGNFIIDSLVLLGSLFLFKIEDKKQWYKKYILKVFVFGMLSDIIGSAYMLFMMLVFDVGSMGDELYLTLPALVLAAGMIFVFNYFVTFKKIDKKQRLQLALIFALVTAPYTFLIPSSWLY